MKIDHKENWGLLLRYLALWNFAVSYPIFSVLTKSPEFFTAHGADRASLSLFIAAVSVLPPLALALFEIGAAFLSVSLKRMVALAVTQFLVVLILLQLMNYAALPPSSVAKIGLALFGASVVTLVVLNTLLGRRFVLALSPIILVAPSLLWLDGGIGQALRGGHASGTNESADVSMEWANANGTPVVLLVFDQLSTSALLDTDGQLDARRWPELAKLAATSTWYLNATTASTETIYSIPALLTGKYPADVAAPTIKAYPRNLFTLLAGQYSLNVWELITSLAPGPGARNRSVVRTAGNLTLDTVVVYGHIVLPSALRAELPPVDGQTAFFGGYAPDEVDLGGTPGRLHTAYSIAQINEFSESLTGEDGSLHFLHNLGPHQPWQFYPSGHRYTNTDVVPGMESYLKPLPSDPGVARGAQHRYLLQAGAVDRSIGRILDRLRELDVFERSLVVITSDHGAHFGPDRHFRQPTMESYRDIIYVPLLIKYPHQTSGSTNKANVSLVDVLPTIADVLGVDFTESDGYPLTKDNPDVRPAKKFQSVLGGKFDLGEMSVRGGGEFSFLKSMVEGMDVEMSGWIRINTPCDDLLGKETSHLQGFLDTGGENIVMTNASKQGYGPLGREEFERGWIAGRIQRSPALIGEPLVAVVVGERVEAITRTYSTNQVSHGFSVILPESVLPLGNAVSIKVLNPDHPRCGSVAHKTKVADRRLEFSNADPAESFGAGWGAVENSRQTEQSSRWVVGSSAELFLELPRKSCRLTFRGATHWLNEEQTMTVSVNGKVVGSISVPTDSPQQLTSLVVPADDSRPLPSRIDLQFSQWNPPGTTDRRELAVKFYELTIE